MNRLWGSIGVMLAVGCAGSNKDQAVRDPQAEQKVLTARERREAQEKEFAAAPADHRRRCELKAGDCLMQLDERRNDFVASNYVAQCRELPNSEAEARCVADTLAAEGRPEAPVDFYGFGAWCYERLNGCTAALADEAAENARLARIAARRDAILFSKGGIDARAAVGFARERIEYLRSTLPPKADGMCAEETGRAACEAAAKMKHDGFEASLQDDEGYSSETSLRLYAAASEAEAKCFEVEYSCLESGVARYGEIMSSKKRLEKNLRRLQRREQLRAQVDEAVAQQCLMAGLSKHQGDIIKGYQDYVDQPVMFFRGRLHDQFYKLHSEQIHCLEKAANDARAARSPQVVPADDPASERLGG